MLVDLKTKERVWGGKTKLLAHGTLLVDKGKLVGFEDEDKGEDNDKYEDEGEGQVGFRGETLSCF